MEAESSKRANVLAVTLVVAVVFQIFLSVLILVELRSLPGKMFPGGPSSAARGLEAGREAPAFTLRDARGEEVSLADFSGRKVLLVFSSAECRFCKEMYPELRRLRESDRASGVQVVMLQLGATPVENGELSRENGFEFPVLAADQETFAAYEVPGTPFATLVTESGTVAGGAIAGSYEEIASLLETAVVR